MTEYLASSSEEGRAERRREFVWSVAIRWGVHRKEFLDSNTKIAKMYFLCS
jgi:hypothetical protein